MHIYLFLKLEIITADIAPLNRHDLKGSCVHIGVGKVLR